MVVFIARFISRVNDELMVCCHNKFIAIRMSSYQFLSQIRLQWIAHCTEIHFYHFKPYGVPLYRWMVYLMDNPFSNLIPSGKRLHINGKSPF